MRLKGHLLLSSPTHTFSEIHQLADEAEDELREMESMLDLLPPPPPTSDDKKTAVDTSIESAVKEMTEIEGKLDKTL